MLTTFTSCSKKKIKIKIVPDLEDCCYKTNSYWVYVDKVNNNTDSVFVIDYDHFYYDYYITDYTTHKMERHTFTTQSSATLDKQEFEVRNQYLWEVHADNMVLYMDYDDLKLNLPECNNYERLDTLFIYDRNYYRVVKVIIPVDCSDFSNINIFYTNAEYGILRHDIYSDTVLLSSKVLMRKNIVR